MKRIWVPVKVTGEKCGNCQLRIPGLPSYCLLNREVVQYDWEKSGYMRTELCLTPERTGILMEDAKTVSA